MNQIRRSRSAAAPRAQTFAIALLLSVSLATSIPVAAQPIDLEDSGPWILRVPNPLPGDVAKVADIVDHLVVDADGALRFQVDLPRELELLQAAGLELRIDAEETLRVRDILSRLRAGQPLETIPGFECYRTVGETLTTGAAIAASYPTLATWTDLGDSWEKTFPGNGGPGFDLQVLKLTNSAVPGPKPDLVVLGGLHAREYTTAELATRFAELLVSGHGVDPEITWILDHQEIHLVLQVNPDGRTRAETGLLWRKNANNDFCPGSNDRGIDLNRNFDFQWGCCGGSSTSACSTSFRGPAARSEPESMAVMDYLDAVFADQRPDDLTTPAPLDAQGIFLDLHAFGEIVLSSWGFTTTDPPNGPQIQTLARKYAFFPGYSAQLGSLGTVDGATKDYAYGRLGVPGYTIELGTSFFQACSTFESQIAPENLAALLHMAKNVRSPYVTPSGPDSYGLALSSTVVDQGDPVTLTATVDDTRYNTAAEPSQTIIAAELFLSAPPWAGGTGVPMLPSDGLFDSTAESVEVSVDTSALAPGQHLLFVRGQDADGNLGALSALFLEITSNVIFADGFETGDTAAWSATGR